MKKLLTLLLSTLFIFSFSFLAFGCNQSNTPDNSSNNEQSIPQENYTTGLAFTEKKDGYAVSIGTVTSSEIIVPAYYKGKPVTQIEDRGFSERSYIEKITFGSNINYIGLCAFYKCTGLTRIVLPDSVTIINAAAFSGCSNLSYIYLGKKLKEIFSNAFFDCYNLTEVKLPDSLTNIHNGAFSFCRKLVRLDIPYGVTTVSQDLFSGCSSLYDVYLPDTIKTIESQAFAFCSNLRFVIISKNVTLIESYAFYASPKLYSVKFDNPDGWQVSKSNETTKIKIPGTQLSSNSTAADCLKTYCDYKWEYLN